MKSAPTSSVLPGSFRDPSGFLFEREGRLYRQINESCRGDFELLHTSGLYEELASAGLLIPHREVSIELAAAPHAYRIIEPERLGFVSYPYEWCFSGLRDAALTTLEIQRRALRRGLSLKDASAYNIQFHQGHPLLIDTLSFEPYREGEPWVAYRQFCQHFLAPLALMCHRDVRLGGMLRLYIDGLPLDLASRLLPRRTLLDFRLLAHLHLHAASQKRYASVSTAPTSRRRVSLAVLQAFVDNLEKTVRRLGWKAAGTEWGDYYSEMSYSHESFAEKERLVSSCLDAIAPRRPLWDLGANTGRFSRIASRRGIEAIAWDIDPAAVERGYLDARKSGETHFLPLLLDLTNPSPALGWANRERMSLCERGPAGAVLALALVHHLAIGNNVPLERIAEFFADLTEHLVVEFVPKDDPQVRRLLVIREDVFPDYTVEGFEAAFLPRFEIAQREPISGTMRVLYRMVRR
jgi:hypothetical protein